MSALYVDTSALARLYLTDEPDARALEKLLLGADDQPATSELSNVELARAMKAAERAGRIASADRALQTVRMHLGTAISLIPLHPETVLPEALRLVLSYRLRTLDAIHLAVALELREVERRDDMRFVTRDADQAAVAKELGFSVL